MPDSSDAFYLYKNTFLMTGTQKVMNIFFGKLRLYEWPYFVTFISRIHGISVQIDTGCLPYDQDANASQSNNVYCYAFIS